MKKNPLILSMLITAAVLLPHNNEGSGIKFTWLPFNKGYASAIKQKKPMIISFYADWCHWCKTMDRETFSDKKIAAYISSNFIPVRIDTMKNETVKYLEFSGTNQQFALAMGASGLPTTAFLDEKGEILLIQPGYMKKDMMNSLLGYINERCYTAKITLSDYMSASPKCPGR